MHIGLIAAMTVVALGASAARSEWQDGTPGAAPLTGYDDFMKLPADQKRDRYTTITAENKATIMRTHAERWLASNRERLTVSEIAMFEEIIAFITADLYGPRPDGALEKRQEALKAKMRCRVSDADVMEALNVIDGAAESPAPKPRWTYLDRAKCWLEWTAEGLLDYVPAPRR